MPEALQLALGDVGEGVRVGEPEVETGLGPVVGPVEAADDEAVDGGARPGAPGGGVVQLGGLGGVAVGGFGGRGDGGGGR